MEDDVRLTAPPDPPTPSSVLAEHLAQCRNAIAECFVCGSDPKLPMTQQLECLSTAERLMRVSLALAEALDKSERVFIHRIIVERPMIDVTPEHTGEPPGRKSKTIHGGEGPVGHNG